MSATAQTLVNQYQAAKWGIALAGPGNATGELGLTGTEAQQAMASTQAGATADGYSVFTTRYLERLSQSSNLILDAGNNITLDFKGDTLNVAAGKSLTLTAGNQITTASAGTITTSNGAINLNATGGIVIGNAFTFNSGGGAINFNNALTLGADTTINSGGGAVTFASTVEGAHNLTVNGGNAGTATFTGAVGGSTGLGAFSITAGGGINLNAVTASSIDLDSSGGVGNIASDNSGILDATSGGITINSGGDVDFSNIGMLTNNQNVSVTAAGNAYLNAINSGTGSLTVNANNVYLFGGGLPDPGNLVGYWNFNEGSGTTATDDSGSGNTGTINGATYSTTVPTALGSGDSLSFNGTSNYVTSSTVATFATGSPFSISGWIYPTVVDGNWYTVISKTNSNNTNRQFAVLISGGYNSTTNSLAFFTNDSGNGSAYSLSTLTANTWYQFVAVYNGSTTKLYLNGVLGTNGGGSASIDTDNGTNAVTIGRFTTQSPDLFPGKIDDVRVYNTALSAQDVTNLYKGIPQWSVGTANITATNDITTDIMGTTLTAGAGKNITMTAGGSVINDSPATISASQSGGSGGNVTLKAGTDIVLPSLTVNSGDGNITLDSDTAGAGGAISLTSSTLNSSGGNITMGGDESDPTQIAAGTGYAYGDSSYSVGLTVTGSTINSGNGSIVINGHGELGASGLATGIKVASSTLAATGSGNVTVNGIGGNNNNNSNDGIDLFDQGTGGSISVVNGNLSITGIAGTGSGNFNQGIISGYSNTGVPSIASTGSGSITITGVAGNGGSDLFFTQGSIGGASDTGNITIVQDRINNWANIPIRTSGTVTFAPYTASTTIGVAGGSGTLAITSGVLGAVTASEIDIGATGDSGLLTAGAYTWGENARLLSGTGGITIAGAQSMGGNSFVAQTTGASDITLGATGSVTSSAAGTAITLASGRNFINNNGSGALAATGGRWLVYSTNPANDTIGGLSTSFRRFSCTYGGSCPSFPAAGNGLLYTFTPTLTATPNGMSITYGDAVPNLTGYAYTLSGYLGSDSGNDSVSGSLNGSTNYSQFANAGSYNLSYGSGSLASTLGYGFAYANNTGGLTVGQKTVTATLTGTVDKTYDSTTAATLASGNYSLAGVINGDTVNLNDPGSGSYDTKNVGTAKTVSVSGLSISGAGAGNYTLASSSISGAVGQIDKAALTVTADDKSMNVGDVVPPLTYVYRGLMGGDLSASFTGALATAGTSSSPAGAYGITIGTLAASGNYRIGVFNNGTLTIVTSPAATIVIPPSVRAVTNQNTPVLAPQGDTPREDDTDSVNFLSALSPTADCSDSSAAAGLRAPRRCRTAN